MGEVYKAEDLALLRTVAIKIINKQNAASPDAEMRFLREARAVSSINHPNIVTVFEIGETDEYAFIVMEYVAGRSLRELFARRAIRAEAMLDIASQVCDALEEAHSRGIVHRDIKPENILVTERGRVKLVDFGLAKAFEPMERKPGGATAVESLTETGAVMGTLSYMSPEQLRGEPIDRRSDIFSFGIVLYEMLTGRLPFTGANAFDVAASILKDEAAKIERPPEGLPARITSVVARLLAKDKTSRYLNFAEVKREIELLKQESPTEPSGESEQTVEIQSMSQSRQQPIASGFASHWSLNLMAPPTVLVLPLETVGAGDEGSFVGVGLAQAIITDLAKINGISVLSKMASEGRIIEGKQSAREIARELGANIILEGEIVRAGETIGVMARLTDVESGRVVWGAQYRGNATDLFTMQDAVCESVAAALKVNISTEVRNEIARPATVNFDAFEFYSKGRSFLERRDVKENIDYAIQMFAAALELDRNFALAYAGLGEAYWLKYQATHDSRWVERAITASDHALVLDPQQSQVHVSLGIVYYGTGKVEQAIVEFEQAASLQPANDEAYRWLGLCYVRKGEMERAVKHFQKAIGIRPGYWENYNRLGSCYHTFGRYRDAAEQFRRVIAIQPDNYRGYSALGGIYTLLGSYEDAIAMHQRAIAIYPNSSSYTNLGTCYFYLGRFDEAIEAYKAAIELDPRGDILYRNLGDAYARIERREEAEAQYERASELLKEELTINSDNAETLGRLAIYQAKLRREQDALASIERAIALEPHNTTLMYQQAVVHALIGRADQAMEYLRLALSKGYSQSEAERDPDLEMLKQRNDYESLFANHT